MTRASINPRCPRCKVRHAPPMHKRDGDEGSPSETPFVDSLVKRIADAQAAKAAEVPATVTPDDDAAKIDAAALVASRDTPPEVTGQ